MKDNAISELKKLSVIRTKNNSHFKELIDEYYELQERVDELEQESDYYDIEMDKLRLSVSNKNAQITALESELRDKLSRIEDLIKENERLNDAILGQFAPDYSSDDKLIMKIV